MMGQLTIDRGKIFVNKSVVGWKVVEAWQTYKDGPYDYVILQDEMIETEALDYAKRLRKTFDM